MAVSPYVFSPAVKIEVFVDSKTLQFLGVTRVDAGPDLHVYVGGNIVAMVRNYHYWRVL